MTGTINRPEEQPAHRVLIRPFRMGRFEVTQAQWQAVMGTNPAKFRGEDRRVEQVSRNDAQAYLQRLNALTRSQPYRLPSEAEWEYAARAGTRTPDWWGAEIGRGNAVCSQCGSRWDKRETAPVGSFKRNAFGLYDTTGNVWERVQDCYHGSYQGAPTNGTAWTLPCPAAPVLRGGSWGTDAWLMRVSERNRGAPFNRTDFLGLRLAQDP